MRRCRRGGGRRASASKPSAGAKGQAVEVALAGECSVRRGHGMGSPGTVSCGTSLVLRTEGPGGSLMRCKPGRPMLPARNAGHGAYNPPPF